MAGPLKIKLNPVEATLRRMLLDVAEYIDSKADIKASVSEDVSPNDLVNEPIILRFTGGWVRDRLLDIESQDIDVAINRLTGYQFGLLLKEYLEIPGNMHKYEDIDGKAKLEPKQIMGGLYKIEANPEKSKHLETVTTHILGFDVDLVNLRKETYTEDSRNPQMEFGTPEEDALRRDATVNALFYNLNTEEVEDFTKKGHEDMKNKIIRTPLEPLQTFKDDPLRVLRLIRFASRLGFKIEEKTQASMGIPDIKDALRRKISRERVGKELEKALRGPDPRETLSLILKLGLYDTIFCDPTTKEPSETDRPLVQSDRLLSLFHLLDTWIHTHPSFKSLIRNEDEQYTSWILAALVPYCFAPIPVSKKAGQKPPLPIPSTVTREGLKLPTKTTDIVTAATKNRLEIIDAQIHYNEEAKVGIAIRRWGTSWRSQYLFSALCKIYQSSELGVSGQVHEPMLESEEALRFFNVSEEIEKHYMEPLLDGKAIAAGLSIKPGPWMKEAIESVILWQIRNPGNLSKEQALEWVKRWKESDHGEVWYNKHLDSMAQKTKDGIKKLEDIRKEFE